MKRRLVPSPAFIRKARRWKKKSPQSAEAIRETLRLLSEDAYQPKLKTHKLKGALQGSWACSVDFKLRVVFQFGEYEGVDAILLESVGTHEEVY